VILGFKTAGAANEIVGEAFDEGAAEGAEAIPKNLPTGGLSVSPGDALAPLRAALAITGTLTKAGFKATKIGFDTGATIAEWARDLAGSVLAFTKDNLERDYGLQEALVGLENMIGDEAKLRIEIFKELESMRQISEEFRTAIAEGQRLIDEREAFNKRVAVLAQRNRYQDMTFRVSRNAALLNLERHLLRQPAGRAQRAGRRRPFGRECGSHPSAEGGRGALHLFRKRGRRGQGQLYPDQRL